MRQVGSPFVSAPAVERASHAATMQHLALGGEGGGRLALIRAGKGMRRGITPLPELQTLQQPRGAQGQFRPLPIHRFAAVQQVLTDARLCTGSVAPTATPSTLICGKRRSSAVGPWPAAGFVAALISAWACSFISALRGRKK